MNLTPAMDTPLTEAVEPSDEACMQALQAGDDAALAPLMQRWERPVKAFIARFGVPSTDVEDVAQETFVRVYQQRAKYRVGAAFKPWVLTIAGNLARNRLRWRFRHPVDSLNAMMENTGHDPVRDTRQTPDSSTDAASLAAEVRKAVGALPAPLREAVVCVELEDMSYADAAKAMACSAKAVETRLYRARQLLRVTCQAILNR